MKEILYFSAPWCQPCKTLGPIVESLSGQIDVKKINVDEDTELAAKYGIRNIPTLLFFKNGQVVNKLVGMQTAENILNTYNG